MSILPRYMVKLQFKMEDWDQFRPYIREYAIVIAITEDIVTLGVPFEHRRKAFDQLTTMFMERGILETDEPNALGYLIEDTIDRLKVYKVP